MRISDCSSDVCSSDLFLINNAGATWAASFEDFPTAAWDKVFNVNVRAPFLLTQALLPLLAARATDDDFSRVINISSVGARMVGDDPSVDRKSTRLNSSH